MNASVDDLLARDRAPPSQKGQQPLVGRLLRHVAFCRHLVIIVYSLPEHVQPHGVLIWREPLPEAGWGSLFAIRE